MCPRWGRHGAAPGTAACGLGAPDTPRALPARSERAPKSRFPANPSAGQLPKWFVYHCTSPDLSRRRRPTLWKLAAFYSVPRSAQPNDTSPGVIAPGSPFGEVQLAAWRQRSIGQVPSSLSHVSRWVWGEPSVPRALAFRRLPESFRLEKTLEVAESNCKPNAAKPITKPCLFWTGDKGLPPRPGTDLSFPRVFQPAVGSWLGGTKGVCCKGLWTSWGLCVVWWQ